MNINEMYIFFLPLINFLGTICLVALTAGSVLFVLAWIIKRIWKGIVAVGVLSFCAILVMIFLGGM